MRDKYNVHLHACCLEHGCTTLRFHLFPFAWAGPIVRKYNCRLAFSPVEYKPVQNDILIYLMTVQMLLADPTLSTVIFLIVWYHNKKAKLTEAQHQVQGGLLLDVVVGQCTAILELVGSQNDPTYVQSIISRC
jgi:hypothetical protein